MHLETLNVRNLALASVPFRPTTMQMPNLALIETKRITLYVTSCQIPSQISSPFCVSV